jgi:iron(III) transport system ATP-binding protein
MLELAGLDVSYGRFRAVREVSFALASGEIGCLLGASGCGKTTVLRAVAGFLRPAAGEITIAGERLSTPERVVAPERRNVGIVPQDLALFPHLTVAGNIGFGLRALDRAARRRRVSELVELIGLGTQSDAWPHQLSGGQRQRVAIARALAPKPPLLLLDEPFSSLDPDLRESLPRELRSVFLEEGVTALLVTHDQREAFAMSDRVGVMDEGSLLQWTTPYALYHEPASRIVADFIGEGVLLPGRVVGTRAVATELGTLDCDAPTGLPTDAQVHVLVRPDDVIHDDASGTKARIVDRVFRGSHFLYTLELESGARILCFAPSHHDHAAGEMLGIQLNIHHVVTFSA